MQTVLLRYWLGAECYGLSHCGSVGWFCIKYTVGSSRMFCSRCRFSQKGRSSTVLLCECVLVTWIWAWILSDVLTGLSHGQRFCQDLPVLHQWNLSCECVHSKDWNSTPTESGGETFCFQPEPKTLLILQTTCTHLNRLLQNRGNITAATPHPAPSLTNLFLTDEQLISSQNHKTVLPDLSEDSLPTELPDPANFIRLQVLWHRVLWTLNNRKTGNRSGDLLLLLILIFFIKIALLKYMYSNPNNDQFKSKAVVNEINVIKFLLYLNQSKWPHCDPSVCWQEPGLHSQSHCAQQGACAQSLLIIINTINMIIKEAMRQK